MTVTTCVLEARAGGRAALDYRDADGVHRSEGWVRVAEAPGRLAFDLAVTGEASFTGHYDLELTAVPAGTRLRLGLRITATSVDAVPAIAGIETGWGQVLDRLTDQLASRKDRTP
jgi:uncharacterized protein YndB with AHSA1/START domain